MRDYDYVPDGDNVEVMFIGEDDKPFMDPLVLDSDTWNSLVDDAIKNNYESMNSYIVHILEKFVDDHEKLKS